MAYDLKVCHFCDRQEKRNPFSERFKGITVSWRRVYRCAYCENILRAYKERRLAKYILAQHGVILKK